MPLTQFSYLNALADFFVQEKKNPRILFFEELCKQYDDFIFLRRKQWFGMKYDAWERNKERNPPILFGLKSGICFSSFHALFMYKTEDGYRCEALQLQQLPLFIYNKEHPVLGHLHEHFDTEDIDFLHRYIYFCIEQHEAFKKELNSKREKK